MFRGSATVALAVTLFFMKFGSYLSIDNHPLMRLSTSIIALLLVGNVSAQITGVPQPQVNTFQPVLPQTPQPATMPRYDRMGSAPIPNQYGQVQMGATADDILRQANRNNPYYGYGNDPASIQRANQAWQQQQMMNDPAYNPALRNGVKYQVPLSKMDEIRNLIQEARMAEIPATGIQRLASGYYKTPAFAKQVKPYTDALQQLKNMLTGKAPLSVANAYFAVESSYGDAYLTQKEFTTIIKRSAAFIKTWMQQNGMDIHNSDDVHLAIQKFISQDLVIYSTPPLKDQQITIGSTIHKHFFYDYDDYQGEKDYKNFFLSKCLATGGGQCSSMPAVYLSLAEALGVPAYLTTAPQHAFIKYKDNNGNIVNYEPTSNWKLSNNWYRDNMFVTTTAKRNRIYLDTFNHRQIVADCMLSLAFGYMKKYGVVDGGFVSDCLTTADKEFKRDNLQSLLTRSCLLARILDATLYNEGITDFRDVGKSKQATEYYTALQQNEEKIAALGYKPVPTELYNDLLKQHEFKGALQDSLHIDGKKKRNLFIEIKK